MTVDWSPHGVTSLYAHIGHELAGEDTIGALAAVSRAAVRRVPGADWASVTQGRGGSFDTVAATDDAAATTDRIQYELRSGPCVDAVLHDGVFRTDDLVVDGRWPEFARRASTETGVRSMLSFRLFIEDDDMIAGLNLYSTHEAAFDDDAQLMGTLIASHGALAVTAAAARSRADHLQRALISRTEIGIAMGVLMARHKVTRDQAFDLLRIASQHSNRKVADLAHDVAGTGTLDLPASVGRSAGRPRRSGPRTGAATRHRRHPASPDRDRDRRNGT